MTGVFPCFSVFDVPIVVVVGGGGGWGVRVRRQDAIKTRTGDGYTKRKEKKSSFLIMLTAGTSTEFAQGSQRLPLSTQNRGSC